MSLFKAKDLVEIVPVTVDGGSARPEGDEAVFSGRGNEVIKNIIGHINNGDTIHYASAGNWSAHDLLEHLLSITGPAKVYITTWAMTENPVRTIMKLIDSGHITELNCIFDFKVQGNAPKAFQLIQGIVSRVKLTHCHAKVLVIENDQWGIAVNGSANFTKNNRIEAGVISADRKIAEFHKSWINKELESA